MRALALGGRTAQAADLADALENVPLRLLRADPDAEPQIVADLRVYRDKYAGHVYDLLGTLERRETGEEPFRAADS